MAAPKIPDEVRKGYLYARQKPPPAKRTHTMARRRKSTPVEITLAPPEERIVKIRSARPLTREEKKRRRVTGVSPTAKRRFLEALREHPNVSLASERSGLSLKAAYAWRKRDEAFAAAWQAALTHAVEALEAEAYERAMTKSDLLMMFLLKAHRPEKYRERAESTAVTVHDNRRIQVVEVHMALPDAQPHVESLPATVRTESEETVIEHPVIISNE